MPKFEVPVTWHMYGTYSVEADTLEQAIDKVLDADEPYDKLPHGEYVDDSMTADLELAKEMNKAPETEETDQ